MKRHLVLAVVSGVALFQCGWCHAQKDLKPAAGEAKVGLPVTGTDYNDWLIAQLKDISRSTLAGAKSQVLDARINPLVEMTLGRLQKGDAISDEAVLKLTLSQLEIDRLKGNRYANCSNLIDKMLPLVGDDPTLCSQLLYLQGRNYRENRETKKAMDCFEKSASLLRSLSYRVDVSRVAALLTAADYAYLQGDKSKAETFYLEAYGYPWYKVKDDEAISKLADYSVRACYGLIRCRKGNLKALKNIQYLPSLQDQIKPVLDLALKEAAAAAGSPEKQAVAAIMDSARSGRSAEFSDILKYEPSKILGELLWYRRDPSETVRLQMLKAGAAIADRAADKGTQENFPELFSETADSDRSPVVSQFALQQLVRRPASTFNNASVEIVQRQGGKEDADSQWLLLIGVIGNEDLKVVLEDTAAQFKDTQPQWYESNAWAAHLALARMGDENHARFCISQFEKTQDEQVRVTHLLEDLSYTRNSVAVGIVKDYLFKEDTVSVGKGNETAVPVAGFSARALWPVLQGFPAPDLQGGGYSAKALVAARQWIKIQDAFEFKN